MITKKPASLAEITAIAALYRNFRHSFELLTATLEGVISDKSLAKFRQDVREAYVPLQLKMETAWRDVEIREIEASLYGDVEIFTEDQALFKYRDHTHRFQRDDEFAPRKRKRKAHTKEVNLDD
jgi:hypothetical protein